MRTIYLIRHGLPDFPPGQRMCLGRTDLPLSQEGMKQAEEAAEKLKSQEITVFSSPLLRARQTAEALHRPIIILEDLQELSAGEWDGLTFQEIRTRYPEIYAARAADKTIPLPGAESNEDGLKRFENAMQTAMEQSQGNLAIVGHGGIMALFLKAHFRHWEKPGYGQIITLLYDNGRFIKQEDSQKCVHF